jgi:DNA adenine methylase
LAKILQNIKGKFLLTINDCPKIRQLYKGLPMLKVNVKYTVARNKDDKDFGELVIANYPLPKQW